MQLVEWVASDFIARYSSGQKKVPVPFAWNAITNAFRERFIIVCIFRLRFVKRLQVAIQKGVIKAGLSGIKWFIPTTRS